jgi:hypothetical protein
MGVSSDINRVALMLELADPATRAALAEIVPVDAVCVEGPVAAPEPIDPGQVDLLTTEEDPLVTCGMGTFRLSALDAPADFEQSDDPLAVALRAELPAMAPELGAAVDRGWRLLHRDDTTALLAAGDPPSTFVTMSLEGDRWRLGTMSASEPCEPHRAVPDGLEEVRWWLDPTHVAPGPDDTELHVLVSGTACSGGEPVNERLIGPQVEVTDDEVLVAFAATPLPNGAYTCPGNPPTPVVVTLDEPVGDRTVVDAPSLPPRPAVGNVEP